MQKKLRRVSTSERNRVWEPAPFTIEERAIEYAASEGIDATEWSKLTIAEMQKPHTKGTKRCNFYIQKE